MPATLFDKLWTRHVIESLDDGFALLHVDRHYITDAGGQHLAALHRRGLRLRNPELCFASPDHAIGTAPGRIGTTEHGLRYLADLRREARRHGITLFDVDDERQGIVHVMGPEQGLTLPGSLVVCADSHTCTNGAYGALAFGIGASQFLHVAATQTIVLQKPRTMRVWLDGRRATGVTAKDVMLYVIGHLGTAAGNGYAVEYAGPAIRDMTMEERMTLCNLAVEMGARCGLISPDDATFEDLRPRPYAPKGDDWHRAVADWRALPTDPGARFDVELTIEISEVAPQITWGTSPQHVVGIGQAIPVDVGGGRNTVEAAQAYMGLRPGQSLEGLPIDYVFIGSCTNSRLSDLRAAAAVARGRRVAPDVTAWVVPGSRAVSRAAEAEGLDRIFRDAGFEWREPGCSMCLAANGETVPAGKRAVSTSNRNFVGRQGPGARTHLASPAMAAAAAVTGRITDVRQLSILP